MPFDFSKFPLKEWAMRILDMTIIRAMWHAPIKLMLIVSIIILLLLAWSPK